MTAMLVFSILSPIENAVRWLLDEFHTFGLPWAWAIVATTIAVRILLVPLTVRQIHSMQSLQKHAPEMKEIQRKYKGDRQKLNEELMKFYRENHINPAASCLPLVAQLPVFFALYFVLKDFSKHPPPGSLSWLHIVPDISAKANSHWSGYLLLAIYAGSQILSSYFMSTTMDKAQRVILMIVPLVFISVVAHFPMGLVLYWVTTNLWTVGQGLITRRLVPKTPMPSFGSRRSRTTPTPTPAPAKTDGKTPAPARAAAPKPKQPKQPAPRRVKKKKGGPRR
ncbi:MAG TPA: YidC/Oxa1 family membrane protein insertase [Gaiellaceae bacterium]